MVYTQNAIESLHMTLRKIIKTLGTFPTDDTASTSLYLALDTSMIQIIVMVTALALWAGVASAATCFGAASPSTPSVLKPPAVPQPRNGNDVVGFNVQNTGSTMLGRHYVSTGQFFKRSQVQPFTALVARVDRTTTPVQLDALALWDDGSVKLGSLTFMLSAMCAKASLPILLSKASASDPVLTKQPAVSLVTAPFSLMVNLTFTGGQYSGPRSVDLAAVAKNDLSDPLRQDYWLRGPLVTQARVERRQDNGPLRITADISVYADGNVAADVMFNNDLTEVRKGSWGPAMPPQRYTATVALNGEAGSNTVTQYQFQDWITRVRSDNARVNVQKDLAYLEQAGAVLPYDRSTGVSNSTINGFADCALDTPLAANCLAKYMPTTGARHDIGYTTQANTIWLLTGDARIADTALAQGDAGGAVPWNFKLSNGRWVTPFNDPQVWIDGRASVSIANQPNFDGTGWTWDAAHQPNLAYVPYIMTGQRWYLDRLNAQAAFALTSNWPVPRCGNGSVATCDLALDFTGQVRTQAWSIREIVQAAYIGRSGTWEQSYFGQVSARNWNNVRTRLAAKTVCGRG